MASGPKTSTCQVVIKIRFSNGAVLRWSPKFESICVPHLWCTTRMRRVYFSRRKGRVKTTWMHSQLTKRGILRETRNTMRSARRTWRCPHTVRCDPADSWIARTRANDTCPAECPAAPTTPPSLEIPTPYDSEIALHHTRCLSALEKTPEVEAKQSRRQTSHTRHASSGTWSPTLRQSQRRPRLCNVTCATVPMPQGTNESIASERTDCS